MSDSAAQGGQIKELKVSGHTMAMEIGLYCVFNTPGGPGPAAGTGLPGVRITVAPSRQGMVSVAAFNADGWIGPDEGALIRVTEGPAEVMVTVYQSPGSDAEAPKLQVVRLSAELGAAPAPAARVAAAVAPLARRAVEAPDGVEVMAHIYSRGDVGGPMGAWMGEPGSQRWIEGFGIAPLAEVPLEDIEYQAVLGRGWLSPWSEGGQFCGSRGMSLPILGLRVRLKGKSAATHRVALSASFVDGTKLGPVGDGAACEAPSLAALEAFHIAFLTVGGAIAAKPAGAKSAVAAGPAKGKAAAIPKSAGVKASAPAAKAPAAVAVKGKGKAALPPPEPAPAARRKAAAPPRRR